MERASVGGTPRGRSSTCEQRVDCPTLTCCKCRSPMAWNKPCKQFMPETQTHLAQPSQHMMSDKATETIISETIISEATSCREPPATAQLTLSTSCAHTFVCCLHAPPPPRAHVRQPQQFQWTSSSSSSSSVLRTGQAGQ